VIEVQDLVKTFGFRGTTTALDHVTFSVPDGARFGLLGASASGKSTVLRVLSTSLRPTSGTARVAGHDILEEPDEVRKQIGYMPQDVEMRAWPTGRDYLRFWARMCGLSPQAQQERTDYVAGFLSLEAALEQDPASYTVDQQRGMSLAQAILSDPKILLLDELLEGVSEGARQFFLGRFEQLASEGRTLVMSTPLLADVRAVCDQVAVMSEGHVTRVFTVTELLRKIGEGKDARVFVDADNVPAEAIAALRTLKGVVDVRIAPTSTILYVTPMEIEMESIRRTLEAHRVSFRGIRAAQLKLGDVFSALNA
jgi:ABC-type multidrug transport system ATPase subunit